MIVSKAWLAAWAVGLGLGFAACNAEPPPSHADVTCAHRGGDHIDRHGGKAEDDRYHISHGELPTCDGDKKDGKDFAPYEHHEPDRHADTDENKDNRHDDTPLPGHRDRPGFNCWFLRCG